MVAGPSHRPDAERDVTLLFHDDKGPARVGDGLEVEEPAAERRSEKRRASHSEHQFVGVVVHGPGPKPLLVRHQPFVQVLPPLLGRSAQIDPPVRR